MPLRHLSIRSLVYLVLLIYLRVKHNIQYNASNPGKRVNWDPLVSINKLFHNLYGKEGSVTFILNITININICEF